MQYKSINEQLEKFIEIIEKNKELMEMLDYISSLSLPNFYIAAGSVFQTIWNYYDDKDLNSGIKDIDIIYYNPDDLSLEKDLEYYNKIKVYAPFGLSDIFTKTIRPIKHKGNSKEIYDKKVSSWNKRFNNLNIIKW